MIRIRQLKLPINQDNEQALLQKVSKKLNINPSTIQNIVIHKKSLDARHKPHLFYVYEVDISCPNESNILKKYQNQDIIPTPNQDYQLPPTGSTPLPTRPIIVGSGPAGLFCAYLLAKLHYKPLIIERGEPIETRVKTVEHFWQTGILNTNSNVQFGEGGAGTFSDGKLNTLVKDKENRMRAVFNIFVECGAPKEILYTSNPHIGTDILRTVIVNMRKKIIQMGGEFHYNICLTNLNLKNNHLTTIEVNNQKELPCQLLVLAIGHSARDTFHMLNHYNLNLTPKPFAVGLRIAHPQKLINQSQYGVNYPSHLPPANYKLTYQTSTGRGVYTFCMCPGGYIVNASSEPGKLAINGMSYSKRDSGTANSALVVTVSPDDYGSNPLDGLKFQQELEAKAYQLGNGKIPIQLVKDFHNNVENNNLGNIPLAIKGTYHPTNLNNLLPDYISSSIKEVLPHFDKKIKGFNSDTALLAGIESRTSSPIRIPRNDHLESNIKGIYPCGEGAGYAGGITTSAMDGLKVAEAIIKTYKN